MNDNCGLVDKSARCRCGRRVATAVRIGRVRPRDLQFAQHVDADAAVGDMEQLHDLASLMRSHPDYKARETVNDTIRSVIASGRFGVID